MVRKKIYITRRLPMELIEKIEENCEVRIWNETDIPIPHSVLEKEIADIDGLICLLTDNIDHALMEKAKNLKIISNMAVGYNNIDIETAKVKGITVTNTPGILTETTADLTFALLLATSRRLIEASEYLRLGKWKTWSPNQLTGQDIFGATLGIIGMGRIGEAVVKRAKGFDMDCIYYNRKRKSLIKEEELGITYHELDSLLRTSDFVCVLTPYTSDTKDFIGEKELSLMKNSSILINTARGGIVNEEALYQALNSRQIYAAGLDVYKVEPVDLNHPLLTLPNVVAMPHIGSASVKTRYKMAELAVENLLLSVKNLTPKSVVV